MGNEHHYSPHQLSHELWRECRVEIDHVREMSREARDRAERVIGKINSSRTRSRGRSGATVADGHPRSIRQQITEMSYEQPDDRRTATRKRCIKNYELIRNDLFANLERASLLSTRAENVIAEARRTRHLSHWLRSAAVESRRDL